MTDLASRREPRRSRCTPATAPASRTTSTRTASTPRRTSPRSSTCSSGCSATADLTGKRREEWLVERLAVVAGVEHLTAFLGNWVLNSPGLDEAGADAQMLDLLRWHGAEEVEHRAVAYDVYMHLDGRYLRRARTYAVSGLVLIWLWVRGVRYLMEHDQTLATTPTARFRDLLRTKRLGLSPGYLDLVKTSWRYVMRACDDVVTITVAAASGAPLPSWDPGAHVDVVLPSGKLRQYSLSGDPADRSSWRIGVRRLADGDGGSIEMHTLGPGQELVLRGPRNAFPFIDVRAYLFVAGGIGNTPILPMLRGAAQRGADWALVYTGRSRATMPFLDELEALGAPDRLHVWPDDEYGVPDGHRILAAAPSDAAVYCCGPPAMLEAIRAVLPGDLVETLHSERFSPGPSSVASRSRSCSPAPAAPSR